MAKLNDLEIKYRQHTKEMEETPPPDMWNRIEASLDAKSSRKGMVWMWRAAAAAMIIGFVGLGVLLLNQNNSENNLYSLSEKPEVFSDESSPSDDSTPTKITTDKTPKTESSNEFITKEERLALNAQAKENSPQSKAIRKEQVSGLQYSPEVPFFSSRKVKVNTLMAQNKHENWNDRFNVNNHHWINEEYPKDSSPSRKIQIGGSISPVYSFRQTSGSQPLPMGTLYANNSYNEKGVTNAGGGLNFNLQLNNRWAVESGVRFARMGQEVQANLHQENIYASAETDYNALSRVTIKSMPLNNSMGAISQSRSVQQPQNNEQIGLTQAPQSVMMDFGSTNNINEDARFEQLIDYLEVPLTLRYYVINRDVRVSIAGGISSNWLISNRVHLQNNEGRSNIGKTEGLSTMNWSTHAGLAFSIPIFGPISFSMEPRVNYFLTEINDDFPVRYRPYSFGVYSGIQYTLGE